MSLRAALVFAFVPTLALASCGSSSSGAAAAPAADARAQALTYARDDIACAADTDCCAVFDGCRAQAYVVSAKDQATVADLLSKASMDMCVGCIAPSAQVSCNAGKCTGVLAIPGTGASFEDGAAFRQNHCGKVALPPGWTEGQHQRETPGGVMTEKILGCGT